MNRKKDSKHFQRRSSVDIEKRLIELEKQNTELVHLVKDLYEVILKKGIIKEGVIIEASVIN